MVEDLDQEQNARVAALKASREVLSERSGGPFNVTTKTADTIDLVSVAWWIIDGKDPWAPRTILGDLPLPMLMNEEAFKEEIENPELKIKRTKK